MKLILGSNSPRRKELLSELGFDFETRPSNVDETIPIEWNPIEAPRLLAIRKAESYQLKPDQVVMTADTMVINNKIILNKPNDRKEAIKMIESLSGKTHQVVSGFCIRSNDKLFSDTDSVEVQFLEINRSEIEYYVDTFKPFDKAGAYGIQEWIGMTYIQSIKGSFYTVMGLPTHKVYPILNEFQID